MFKRLTCAEAVRPEVSSQRRTFFGDSSVGFGTAYFGGGRAPLVLKWRTSNSTRTLFLHGEERVETGGYEFNIEAVGGN